MVADWLPETVLQPEPVAVTLALGESEAVWVTVPLPDTEPESEVLTVPEEHREGD